MRHSDLVYTSPEKFTFLQRVILATAPPAIAGAFRLLYGTCRVETHGADHWRELVASGRHYLVAIWHESMAMAAWRHRNSNFHTLTSYSFDGELAARVVHQFGIRALRGSSTRGGMTALVELGKATQLIRTVGFTLDGPQGPRRVAKPGMAILACKYGLPVIPNAFAVTPAWRMRSWDRLPIAKPFARMVVGFAPPILPAESATPEEIEDTRVRIETSLNELHREIEANIGSDPMLGDPQDREK